MKFDFRHSLVLVISLICLGNPLRGEEPDFSLDPESVKDFMINHADLLEFLKDRVILNGDVSITGTGKDSFTLVTPRLESVKDSNDEFSVIETFGVSKLISEKYILMADKMYFRKVKSARFNQLEAIGSIHIEAVDQRQKLIAEKVYFDLESKKLHAVGNVHSEQLVETNGKLSLAKLDAEDQIINLFEDRPDQLAKQIEAKGNTHTEFDGIKVQSEQTDFYAQGGKADKVVFSGAAELTTPDQVHAQGEQIEYFLNESLIKIRSRTNLNPSQETENAFLVIPFNDKDGKISQLAVQAEYIENHELAAQKRNLLYAEQTSHTGLVRLDYQQQRGYGRQLFIVQDKSIPDQKGDFLYLIDKAKIIDLTNKQILEAPFIKIGLGDRSLLSGITGRSHGVILLKKDPSGSLGFASDTPNQKTKK
ncbi:MAG: hypothetical protein SFT81_03035 [Candidatus Caenarcaniphilales bacterium]|nr:hypothetical protein [Candidatus Caenarcaniphilales bacterium]